MTESTGPDSNETKRPFYRSPFFWGFIIGALILTAIRPFMRRIPDPPDQGLELPELVGRPFAPGASTAQASTDVDLTPGGAAIGIVTIADANCEDRCMEAFRVANDVNRRMGRTEVDAAFSTIVPNTISPGRMSELASTAFPYASNWRMYSVQSTDELARVLDARDSERSARSFSTIASEGYLWIVDSEGFLRGRYDSGANDAASEVYHRSLRVLGRY